MKSSVLFVAVIVMMTVSAAKLRAQDADRMNRPRPRTEHREIDGKKRDALDRYLKKQDASRHVTSGTSADSCSRKHKKKQCWSICRRKNTANPDVDSTNVCKSQKAK